MLLCPLLSSSQISRVVLTLLITMTHTQAAEGQPTGPLQSEVQQLASQLGLPPGSVALPARRAVDGHDNDGASVRLARSLRARPRPAPPR